VNSDMGWNNICDYVRKYHITGECEPAFWDKVV